MKLVTVAEMREIEKQADAGGLTYAQMMENAGLGVADVVERAYNEVGLRNVTGLVGSGNNGGDTLVALTSLAFNGWEASAYLAGARPEDDPLLERFKEAGGEVVTLDEDDDLSQLEEMLGETEVLLDGILGTGIQLPLRDTLPPILKKVAEHRAFLQVVAVDCPSGVDCDTGAAAPETIPADITVCMAAVKTGLLIFPAFDLVGTIEVVGIGLPDELESWQSVRREVISAAEVMAILPVRKNISHKGTFGTAMIVAGSLNYTGAVLLAGKAAYRAGAGLVRLAVPGPLHGVLAGHLPEATWLLLPHMMGVITEEALDLVSKNLDKVTALLVGPGLGLEDTTAGFIRRLSDGKTTRHPRGAIGFVAGPVAVAEASEQKPWNLPPLIVDADGLRLLAKVEGWTKLLPAGTILTPHPGEMAALTGLSVEEIQADRMGVAQKYAREWGHVIVLKGAVTLIAAPDGRLGVIPVASAALARAGTGDVLAGLITGLRAQGLSAFDSASAGAWIHARAGLSAAGLLGSTAAVLAGDVLEAVPEIMESVWPG